MNYHHWIQLKQSSYTTHNKRWNVAAGQLHKMAALLKCKLETFHHLRRAAELEKSRVSTNCRKTGYEAETGTWQMATTLNSSSEEQQFTHLAAGGHLRGNMTIFKQLNTPHTA